jgi:hypothetical protein
MLIKCEGPKQPDVLSRLFGAFYLEKFILVFKMPHTSHYHS